MADNMGGIDGLDFIRLDILKEIGSIGSGNAITALSQMLNKRISMSVPQVNLPEFKDIANFIGGAENLVIGILVGMSGDINGIMMFLVPYDSAHKLLEIVMGDMGIAVAANEFTEMERSALTEVGNILISSYLGAFAGLIEKAIKPTVPSLSIDMANAILSVPAIEFGKVGDRALFIESVFDAEGSNVSGYFLLVPDMDSFNIILASLGVK